MATTELSCEVLIIGSGPGGATTAALLAEAGRDVLIVEEGPDLTIDSAPSYSMAELDQKYRNGGLNTSFGRTQVTYIEGRCVGGASEINAALYHRPHERTLEDWRREYQIADFGPQALVPEFQQIEQEMSVSRRAEGLSPSSQALVRGADKLGWKHAEIERFWKYSGAPPGQVDRGRRQSMSETLIPRARRAGARLLADTKVRRLVFRGPRAVEAHAGDARGAKVRIRFQQVVLAAGAVQTPVLLRRSGVRHNIGDALRLHPMIRVAARFDHRVNDPAYGVPVQQVEEFKPALTLGCSHSSPPHIALWLGRQVPERQRIMAEWEKVAVFYVAVQGEGRGTVRVLPGVGEPLVRYENTDRDHRLLGEGLHHLGRLLFEAGARQIMSPIDGEGPIDGPAGLTRLLDLPYKGIAVSTIHLFSSLPMGEDRQRCAVDSYGRLHGYDNVRVHDASILPKSPGVNPQGTIMAIVRRNTRQMLS